MDTSRTEAFKGCYIMQQEDIKQFASTLADGFSQYGLFKYICNGKYSMRSFELMDKKQPLLPADKLAALEKRLYERHAAAVEKARVLLRTSTKHTVKTDVAKILNDTFAENFKDLEDTVKANTAAK